MVRSLTTIAPPRLRPQDLVRVLAPAGPADHGRLAKGLARLESRYRLDLDPTTSGREGFLSAPDQVRADALQRAFRDPDVRAIFVARGGHGLTRILSMLDPADFVADPKPIVGFSDTTALLHWALVHGVRSIHGPVTVQLGDLPDEDIVSLIDALESPVPPGPRPWPLSFTGAPRGGQLDGTLVGGNLCLLSHLCGTPWLPTADDLIWLLEDVGEKPYALDRYLTHLGNAGALLPGHGAIVGDFARCAEDPSGPLTDAFAVIDERLARFSVGGLAGAPIGHGTRNVAVAIGGKVQLDFAAHVVIQKEAAVS